MSDQRLDGPRLHAEALRALLELMREHPAEGRAQAGARAAQAVDALTPAQRWDLRALVLSVDPWKGTRKATRQARNGERLARLEARRREAQAG